MHKGKISPGNQKRDGPQPEQIVEIQLSELFPFKDHPFRVVDDDRMQETAESIRQFGVLVPAIVRPLDGGGYEIVSGHRRKRACELAGLETMPAIIRNLDDDAAVIIMVDSNLQRENILPSERAKAFQMKMEALKHKLKDLSAPNSPNKTHFMVEISPHFDALASTKDNDRLFAMLPYKSLCFTSIKNRHGVYAMINKDERRDVSIRKPRPSIRKQLADSKQATSPKKAAARTKKNELEV